MAAERIEARAGTGDPSDATVEVAALMARAFATWPQATTIDTTASVQESVARAVEAAHAPMAPAPRAGHGRADS